MHETNVIKRSTCACVPEGLCLSASVVQWPHCSSARVRSSLACVVCPRAAVAERRQKQQKQQKQQQQQQQQQLGRGGGLMRAKQTCKCSRHSQATTISGAKE